MISNQNSIFRKTSLERVSSPEQLNDYIKVTRPGVWLILAAVGVMLIAALVWSVFGTLTTTRNAVAVVTGGKTVCYLLPKDTEGLTIGTPVQIANSTGSVTGIATTPTDIPADFDTYALYLGDFQVGDFVVSVTADIKLQDGVYPAKVILESVSPISFILN